MNELGWETLETRRNTKKVIMLYKMQHKLVDISAGDHLKHQKNKGTRGHTHKFIQISYNKDRYGDTFFPSTIPLWNNLPTSAVEAATVESFKSALQRHRH